MAEQPTWKISANFSDADHLDGRVLLYEDATGVYSPELRTRYADAFPTNINQYQND